MTADRTPRDASRLFNQLETRVGRLERRGRGFSVPPAEQTGGVVASATPPPAPSDPNTLWIDTDDGNRIYRWNGSMWVPTMDPAVDLDRNSAATQIASWQDDEATADGLVTLYRQSSAPASGLATGDLWVDTDNDQLYRWSGSAWGSLTDTTLGALLAKPSLASTVADGRIRTWWQFGEPVATGFGDLWIKTSDSPSTLWRWNNYDWIQVLDWSVLLQQEQLDQKISTWYLPAPPTSTAVGDIWYDTDDDNHPYRAESVGAATIGASQWVSVRDGAIQDAAAAASSALTQATAALDAAQAAQATADGAISSHYGPEPPWADGAGGHEDNLGDLWYDTDTNQAYRWDGDQWALIQDNAIAEALAAAQDAQTTADGKITAFYVPNAPANGEVGDLWFDTDDQNKPYYWDGDSWELIRDQGVSEALSLANGAISGYVTEYAVNTSEVTPPSSGWSTATPSRTPGSFIWVRTTVTRGDGTSSTTNPALLTGNTGAQGNDGPQGIQGPPGANGEQLYTWIKYADTPTTGMSDLPAGKQYLGIAYNKTTQAESSTYSDYLWSSIVGADGQDGIQGPPGADGQTTYTWVKYGTSALGAGMSDDPAGKTYIGLAYNKLTPAESSDPAQYAWSLIQGPAGADAATITLIATAQVLVSPSGGGATTPATSTITGSTVNTTITSLEYSVNGGSWTTTAPAGFSSTGNVVTATGATMTAKTVAVKMSDGGGRSDTLTIAKVSDGAQGATGAAGADAYTVLLTNESHVFAGTTTAAVPGSTTSQIVSYKGGTQVAATIGTVTGQVTGLSTTIQNNASTTAQLTVTVDGTLTQQNGVLVVPITVDSKSFSKRFTWSVARTGAQGSQGIPGTPGADGTTYYTWLKYASSATPAPADMSDSPTGKTYIGIAVNKTTATESTDYLDYSWSLIQGPQGNQGIPGTPGADGQTTYTWVKYAPNGTPTSAEISDTPAGMTHIGLAFNKTTATESTTPGEYQWSLIQGPKGDTGATGATGAAGRGVASTAVTYAKSTSGTTAPAAGSFTGTIPTTVAGEFLWTRTITNYTDGLNPTTAYSVSAHGATGAAGAAGRGISSTLIEYAKATSGTVAPSTGWGSSIPATVAGEFLWTRTTTSYTSGSPTISHSVAAHGSQGPAGPGGEDGTDGVGITGTTVTYQTGTSGTDAPTGTWQTSPTATTAGQFLWTRTITTLSDASTSTAYAVAAHGATGAQGSQGNQGVPGVGITGTTVDYQKSSSGTDAPTGSWVSAPVATTTGEFLWTRTVTTYSSGSPTTAYSVAAHGAQGVPGANAPSVYLTASTQLLSSPAGGGATTPATAQITGSAVNTSITEWTYSVNGGSFSSSPPAGVSIVGNVVTVTGSTMTARTITVKAANSAGVSDTLTVAKAYDGAQGATGSPGANGVGITGTVVSYAKSTSGTTEPSTGWGSSIPATTTGEYLWTRTVTSYTSGSPTTAYSVAAHGATGSTGSTGATGSPGRGISSTAVTYQVGTSGTDAPTGTWLTTVPATTTGQFLWTRTITTFTSAPLTETAYSVAAHGATGATGATGSQGVQGVSVTAVTPYWAKVATGAAAPAKPTTATPVAPWVAAEPVYTSNTELYRTEKVTFSNSTFSYTDVSKSSSYAAAVAAAALATAAQSDADQALADAADAQATADGKARTFFQTSAPTGLVAGDVGDLWFDTDDGNKLYRWNGTAWVVSQDQALASQMQSYVQSRGSNLVTNGTGLLGDATNFPGATFVSADAPTGAKGSFRYPASSGGVVRQLDELIPVDPSKVYEFAYEQRQVVGQGRFYSYLAPHDAYGLPITTTDYMEQPNTRTTLAAPLNPGATTMTLTSAANWNNAAGANTHLRTIIFWDYVDQGGKAWAPGTYSKNWIRDAYADGAIAGNIVTLRTPYAGPARPAGTSVGNGSAGGTYMYIGAINALGSEQWTRYAGRTEKGAHTNLATSATSRLPLPTAAVRLGYLLNYPHTGTTQDPTGQQAVANVSLTEITAASDAQATANTKITTFWQSGVPTSISVGDLWVDTGNGNRLYRAYSVGSNEIKSGEWHDVRDTGIAAAASAASAAQTAATNAMTAAQAAQATADGAISTYYQTTAPWANGTTGKANNAGDMWFDTDDGQAYRWNDTTKTWQVIEDNSIAAALAAAQNAQTTADGKINAYYQTTAPTVNGAGATLGVDDTGDLWYDTDDGNKPYYWDGNSWENVQDQAAATALQTYVTEYAVNSSETVAPASGWSTATPTRTPGTFIWVRTKVTRNDGTNTTTSPALLTGNTGSQGIPGSAGADGADGASLYTWLKYADTPTTGMSDSPVGKTYMGIAYNKTSPTEGTNYGEYFWSLIKGADGTDGDDGAPGAPGRGISSTAYTYQVSTSGVTPPTGTWQTSPQATTTGQFLWTRTIITYTDSTTSTPAYSVSAHGATGAQGTTGATGAAGRGISSTTSTYQVSSSGTDVPTGTWLSTVPATSQGQYLWTKTVATYTDATTSSPWYSVSAHGAQGNQGIQGPPGANGQPTYTWVKYATSATPTTIYDEPDGMTYIGLAYNKLTATESSTPGEYQWSLIQGPQGPQGNTGAAGADAYTILLTNESQTIPAGVTNALGTGGPFITDALAYKGSTQKVISITQANITGLPTGMTATVTNNNTTSPRVTFTVTTALSTPSGQVTIPVVVDGITFNQVFSYALSYTGATGTAGAAAETINLSATTQILSVPAAGGATTPTTAVISGTATNTTIGYYDYKVDGGAWNTTPPTGVTRSGNDVTVTGATFTGKTLTVRMAKSNGSPINDTMTVSKVSDGAAGAAGTPGTPGADAYTVLLTNEAQTIAAGTSAAIANTYTTNVNAWKGTVAQSVSIGTITGLPTGMSAAISGSPGTNPLITFTVSTSLVTEKGQVTIPVTVGSTTFSKTFSWALSKTGAQGTAGANAPAVYLTATTQVLSSPAAGGATTPATATVTGEAANTTISAWTYSVDGTAWNGMPPAGVTRSGNVVTVTGATFTGKTVAVKMADAAGVSDTITVAKVANGADGAAGTPGAAGADAYTVLLTNESITFPAGTTNALSGSASSKVIAYKGSTQIPATIGTVTGQVSGLTTAISNNASVNAQVDITVSTSLTTNSGSLIVPLTIDGKSFTRVITWALSKTGAQGSTGSTGVGVTSITPYWAQVADAAAAPAKPTTATPVAPWVVAEPTYAPDTDLYRTEKVLYSNSTYAYSNVVKLSTYEAAAAAYDLANTKNKVTVSTSLPGATPNRAGDIWFQKDESESILAQYEGLGGTSWLKKTINGNVLTADTISATHIVNDYLYTNEISASQIKSDILDADIALAGLIRAKGDDPNRRVELTNLGIKAYNSLDNLVVNISTESDTSMIDSTLISRGLTVTDGMEIRGQRNVFTVGSKSILQTGVVGSTSPPSMIVDYPVLPAQASQWFNVFRGISVDNADSATPTIRTTGTFFDHSKIERLGSSPGHYNFPIDVTRPNGELAGRYSLGSSVAISVGGNIRLVTVGQEPIANTDYLNNDYRLYSWDESAMTSSGNVAPVKKARRTDGKFSWFWQWRIGRCYSTTGATRANWVAEAKLNVWPGWPNNTIKLSAYSITDNTVGSSDVGFTPQISRAEFTANFMQDKEELIGVSFGSSSRMGYVGEPEEDIWIIHGTVNNYVFKDAATPVRQPNREFPAIPGSGTVVGAGNPVTGEFQRFVSAPAGGTAGEAGTLYSYTNITWTTESSKWWGAFSWYDSVGTTHETLLSARSSVVMKKRARLGVTVPELPDPEAGKGQPRGIDDVDSFRFFLNRGTTEPTLVRQAQQPPAGATSYSVDAPIWAGGGALPTLLDAFPVAAAASFESNAAGTGGLPKVKLTGDGFAHFEALDVGGDGASSLTGKAFEQLYYSIRAQSQLVGGGVKAVDASYNISWSQRFLATAIGKSSNLAASGWFDITMPPNGTVIPGYGGASSVTVSSGKIPLASWNALWYELPYGSDNTSISGNFRITSYNSDFTVPNNWILLAVRNYDANRVEWVTGEYVDPNYTSDIYNIGGQKVKKFNTANHTASGTNASARTTHPHGLGMTPTNVVVCQGHSGSNLRLSAVDTYTSTTFSCLWRNGNDNTLATSLTQNINVSFLALAE